MGVLALQKKARLHFACRLICCRADAYEAPEFFTPEASPVACCLRAFQISRGAAIQLPFHRRLSLLMELAGSLIAFRSRRGQMAEFFPRAFLLYLGFLPPVNVLLFPRECLEFHVSSQTGSHAGCVLVWRAASATCQAKPSPLETLLRQAADFLRARVHLRRD
jgi:hypothetical protein